MTESKICLILFLAALLLVSVLGVVRGEEQWFLISGTELRSIELYKETSETEKQNWLSQVQNLNQKLLTSETKSAAHELTVNSLNNQLSAAREDQRKSVQLFDQSETARLTQLSLKNGEIAEKDQVIADQKLILEKVRNQRNIAFIAIGLFVVAVGVGIYIKRIKIF